MQVHLDPMNYELKGRWTHYGWTSPYGISTPTQVSDLERCLAIEESKKMTELQEPTLGVRFREVSTLIIESQRKWLKNSKDQLYRLRVRLKEVSVLQRLKEND